VTDREAQYRLLFEANPQPMWVYDVENLHFLAVNDAAVRHYGYSRAEFLAMTIKDIRPPEDVQLLADYRASFTDEVDYAGEWRHRKKDGTTINVEITATRLNFGGRRAEFVLAQDITERKRAETALRVFGHGDREDSACCRSVARSKADSARFAGACRG